MDKAIFFERLKSEGILLAILSFLGSLTAFAFEMGYLTYYDVPYDVISLGIYRIMVSALWISLVFAIVWVCVAGVIAIAISPNNAVKTALLGVLLVVLIALIIQKAEFNERFLSGACGALVIPAILFINWLISENGPLGKKLSPPIARIIKDGQNIASAGERLSSIYFVPFSLTAMMLFLVCAVGYWTARIGRNEWVLDDQPNFVLVRKYDNAYIFKEFDPKTKKLADRVQIINLSEEKKITLKKVDLRISNAKS